MLKPKTYHQLQIRFPGSQVKPGMEFTFRKTQLVLGDAMPQTLAPLGVPIDVSVNGYTRQFKLFQDGKRVGAAWFYFYRSFEGRDWGILDELAVKVASDNAAAQNRRCV